MTNKEALKILRDISIDYGDASADQMNKIDEAMDKAIKTLEEKALIMENDIKNTNRCSNCPILPWEDEKNYCEKCSHLDQRLEPLKTRVIRKKFINPWVAITTQRISKEEAQKIADQLGDPVGLWEDAFYYTCDLPQDGQEVLITTYSGHLAITTFRQELYSGEGVFYYFEDYEDEDDVKAWMPLPDIYKENSKNDQ